MTSILERNNKINQPKKTREEYAEDALYREVWEEVNNEKTTKFIKKYARHLIGGAFAIIAVATSIQIGVNIHNASKIKYAGIYETGVASADSDVLESVSKNSQGAIADLALFQSYLLDKNIEKLEKLAEHGATRDFRDLAKMHIIGLRGDDMTAHEVASYLNSVNTKKSPFYYTSRLTVARKYLSDGDRDTANRILDTIINDSEAPATISAAAQTLK